MVLVLQYWYWHSGAFLVWRLGVADALARVSQCNDNDDDDDGDEVDYDDYDDYDDEEDLEDNRVRGR